ncbi:MAG TPA: CRISPR-associated protein Cas4 [Gammaproteobacteria bacterium]|nr:CRISPR-associated protein Cas4 [Gammaproteobacteria bacterium]
MSEDSAAQVVALSALQHYSYCPRQCALIHVEQSFDENLHTLRGRVVHERVDEAESCVENGIRIERALPLYSEKFGLVGKADVVEFLPDGTPYPVEYKHGPRRTRAHDEIQLAGQALCLEEMTGYSVPEGAIYHHSSRRRRVVAITDRLRKRVIDTAKAIQTMLQTEQLPLPPEDRRRCQGCSLTDLCQPELVAAKSRLHELRHGLFNPDAET